MRVNDIDYVSSYVITNKQLGGILFEYEKIVLNDINIYYDKNVDVNFIEKEQKSIFLIGYCFDIRDADKNENEILIGLLESENLHEELDYINGRYNLIIHERDEYYIYTDASQLRPLVYHKESKVLTSHDSLMEEILSKLNFEVLKREAGKHNELDYTRYKEVFKFNPSLYLAYNTFEFVRFYPRVNLVKKNSKETFNEIKNYLDQSKSYLGKLENKIFVTVTGGIDSRVSAALTRDFSNKVEYITYTKPLKKLATKMAKIIYRVDEDITRDMKNYLGWDHTIFNLDDYIVSKHQNTINHILFNSIHSYSLANYYKRERQFYKAIHVKSTVFGMGKADFKKALDNHEDTYEFYKKCIHGLPKGFEKRETYEEEILSYFDRNHVYEGVSKGRHYFDLFHLESRMGNWHSMLTLETDPETEEFIFTNTRKAIDLIQQPSIDERRDYTLYKMIVEHYWPVLLEFGINKPRNKNISSPDNSVNNQAINYRDANVIAISKVNITKTGSVFKIKPSIERVSVFDNYSFAISNDTQHERKLKLTSFYKNKKAKGSIQVIIRQGENIETFDILELNKGLRISYNERPVIVSIVYKSNFIKESWVEAGLLKLEVF